MIEFAPAGERDHRAGLHVGGGAIRIRHHRRRQIGLDDFGV
jgi:hypothetical protein